MPDLTGQRVLVTGAAGGVGAGIAECFVRSGASVALHGSGSAKSLEKLHEMAEALRDCSTAGQQIAVVAGKLPAAATQLVRDAAAALGGLSGVVNNAGMQPVAPLTELTPAAVQEMLAVNLESVFTITQQAALNGVQWVTHIASIEASRPAPAHAHYAAAKAGVVMQARAAALELGPQGVRVNTVSPGLVAREGLAEAWPEGHNSWLTHAPLRRLVTPQDVGNACVFLASPLAAAITGHDLVVDAGMLTTPGW